MSEPKRWLEQGAPPDVEQLFRAAQAEKPDSASLRRSLAAAGVGLGAANVAANAKAAAAAVGGATKATTPLMAGVFAKWTALGALGGALAVGVAEVATQAPHAVAPSSSSHSSAPLRPGLALSDASRVRVAPTETSPAALPAPAAVPPESTTTTAAPHAPRFAVTDRDAAAPPPASRELAPDSSSVDADTLAAEVKSIDRARAALAAGKPDQALLALDDYERLFPKRGFAPEALYLRMEAWSALGRTAEARAVAERLLARYPNSLHTAQARAVLSKNQ